MTTFATAALVCSIACAQYESPQSYIGRVSAASDADYAAQRARDAERRAIHRARTAVARSRTLAAGGKLGKPALKAPKPAPKSSHKSALPSDGLPEQKSVKGWLEGTNADEARTWARRLPGGMYRVVEVTTETRSEEHTSKNGGKWYRESIVKRDAPVYEAWQDLQLLEVDLRSLEAAQAFCVEHWLKNP
jgi:hypothetical protein